MYTTQPMVDNQAYDFVIAMAAFMFFCLAMIVLHAHGVEKKWMKAHTWVSLVIISVFSLIIVAVWREPIVYANIPVKAKYVSIHGEVNVSGKSVNHYLYALYKTPDGLVPILVAPGVPLPENAVLYKN